jgi:hypothetical protein
LGGVIERSLDRGHGGLSVAFREVEHRKSWLWVATELVRLPERVACLFEITHAQADLADLVEAFTCEMEVEVLELGSGATRFAFGLSPRSSKPHDLRTMHPAYPGEPGDRLSLAPPS